MKYLFILTVLLLMPAFLNAQTLTLEQYLDQVQKKNQNYTASKEAGESYRLRQNEASTLLRPTLFGQYASFSDESLKTSPSFMGTKTVSDGYQVGISQATTVGLSGQITYGLQHTNIAGVAPGLIQPGADSFEAKTSLDLSFSLLRNGLGSEVRSAVEVQEATLKAGQHLENYRQIMTRAEAESFYWRLCVAREVLQIAKDSLSRAEKIRDWSASRAKMNLADQSDFLQAEAIVKLRTLEVQNSQDELRSASLAFNSSRNLDSDEVKEKLIEMHSLELKSIAKPKRQEVREDVKNMVEMTRASKAQSQLGVEKNKPNLDLFGNYTTSSKAVQSSDANGSPKPITTMGVRFSVPLDLGLSSDNREGYRKEISAAESRLNRKLFEQEKDWKDLESKYREALRRYELSKALEEVQMAKYQREKTRHANGRTTTYFVLMFEQDYASAQVNRLRAEADVLGTLAQMKTFGGSL